MVNLTKRMNVKQKKCRLNPELPKMEFKTSDNSYKPIKSHWLGNASRSVCVESEIWM